MAVASSWPEVAIPDFWFALSLSFSLAVLVAVLVRPSESDNRVCCDMVPDNVYGLCHSERTVTSELARDPTQTPLRAFHGLYRGQKGKKSGLAEKKAVQDADDSLRRAYECGRWGDTKPSPLFLKVSGLSSYAYFLSDIEKIDIPRCSMHPRKEPHGWRRLPAANGQPWNRPLDHCSAFARSLPSYGELHRARGYRSLPGNQFLDPFERIDLGDQRL